MAFRFVGTRITGPRGDSGVLVFCADADTAFTNRDRLVFFLSRPDGGMVMKRTMKIDENGCATLTLGCAETDALAPGVYLWSALCAGRGARRRGKRDRRHLGGDALAQPGV